MPRRVPRERARLVQLSIPLDTRRFDTVRTVIIDNRRQAAIHALAAEQFADDHADVRPLRPRDIRKRFHAERTLDTAAILERGYDVPLAELREHWDTFDPGGVNSLVSEY